MILIHSDIHKIEPLHVHKVAKRVTPDLKRKIEESTQDWLITFLLSGDIKY